MTFLYLVGLGAGLALAVYGVLYVLSLFNNRF